MRELLPDPEWRDTPGTCVRCNYDLRDMPAPGRCPECGWEFDARCLSICGLAARAAGPLWRRVVWGVTLVGFVLFAYTWPLFLMMGWVVLVVVAAGFAGTMVFMLSTSRRERRGTERFLFSRSGIARASTSTSDDGMQEEAAVIPWQRPVRIELKPVGPYWANLTIWFYWEQMQPTVAFRAGVRCPRERLDEVRATLEAFAAGAVVEAVRPPAAPPTTREQV